MQSQPLIKKTIKSGSSPFTMDNFFVFKASGNTYLFGQNKKKIFQVYNLDANGLSQKVCHEGQLDRFYKTTCPIIYKDKSYVFADSEDRQWFISELDPAKWEKIATKIRQGDWKFYEVALCIDSPDTDDKYLYAQSKTDTKVFISSLNKPEFKDFGEEIFTKTGWKFYNTASIFQFKDHKMMHLIAHHSDDSNCKTFIGELDEETNFKLLGDELYMQNKLNYSKIVTFKMPGDDSNYLYGEFKNGKYFYYNFSKIVFDHVSKKFDVIELSRQIEEDGNLVTELFYIGDRPCLFQKDVEKSSGEKTCWNISEITKSYLPDAKQGTGDNNQTK